MSHTNICSKIELSRKEITETEADIIVLAVGKTKDGAIILGETNPNIKKIEKTFPQLGFSGNLNELVRIPAVEQIKSPAIALVGIGKVDPKNPKFSNETLRNVAGCAARELAGMETIALFLPHTETEKLGAIVEGALYGAYSYNLYRSEATLKNNKKQVKKIIVNTVVDLNEETTISTIERAKILANSVHIARNFVNQPPADLYPESFVEAINKTIKNTAIEIQIWDENKLKTEGFGGILGVGKGSQHPPRLVKLSYNPNGAKKHLALVGKGITFDSGGISIKPSPGMDAMKGDMAGAAAIFSALLSIEKLKLPTRVTAWLALAENMPSGTASKPSDVLHMFGGKTVEVLNTDAEGRLVMGDALVAASEENPDIIIDVATLTGAQGIALGRRTSAIMGDENIRNSIKVAADQAGENFWPMPLPEELLETLSSNIADIANIGERYAGMLSAGVFLQEFVGSQKNDAGENIPNTKIPWAHLDIASPAYNTSAAFGYTPKAGTGVAVRTLVTYAESIN